MLKNRPSNAAVQVTGPGTGRKRESPHLLLQAAIQRQGTRLFFLLPTTVLQLQWLIDYKDTKTKCRLYWCSMEFIDWRDSQSYWYFRPSFVNYSPLTFPLVHLPLPPFPVLNYSIHGQCGWEGMGRVLSCVGDHNLQEFNKHCVPYLTRFRT